MSLLNESHKELIAAAENGSLVIFAGAGISKSVGLPLWEELILKIIEHINTNNSDHGATLKSIFKNRSVKNRIFETLNYVKRNDLDQWVNHILKSEIYQKGSEIISGNAALPLHSKLLQLSKKIITSNYDYLFEASYEFKFFNIQSISNRSILHLSNLSSNSEYLLKIHGNISEIADLIFYEDQYIEQYKSETAIISKFKELITNNPILFVGTSMSDPYINEIIHNVNAIFHSTNAQNFILSNDDFENTNIIRIPGDPINDLNKLLDELCNLKKLKDKPIIINPVSKSISEGRFEKDMNKLNLYPKPKQYFTGRAREIDEFKHAIDAGNNFIAVDGAGGIGKTQFVSMCIEKFVLHEKVMWFDCKPESQFDTLITFAGYPELLEGTSKTDRDKFSAFKDKIQENNYFLFLDNFQETNSKPIFKEFLLFIQDYLKSGCVIIIDRDDVTNMYLKPKRIHIEEFKENKLEYAKALIQHSYNGLLPIDDAELTRLCEELQGYPLAIDFAILLLSEGEKHSDIISKIVEAEGSEEISERLLNAIFNRPDATQEERDFMRQFSVFTGSVSEEVVKGIISSEIFANAPKKLRKKNLLSINNGNYEIHSLIRAFCYKEFNNKEALHGIVADYYIRERHTGLNPILEERIFYHLIQSRRWEQIGKEIEENGRQFILQGQLGLVKELIENLIRIGNENPLFNIYYGDIAEIQGNWDSAQKYYELAINQQINKYVKAEGMIKFAEIHHRKGNVKVAFRLYEEAYDFAKSLGSLKKEEARAINDIGLAYDFFGAIDLALGCFEKSLMIREQISDQEGIATSFGNIGEVYRTRGNLVKSLEYYEKRLKIEAEIGNKQGMGSALSSIGQIYRSQGELTKSLLYHENSLKLYIEMSNKQGIASSFSYIGGIYFTKGELAEALEYHRKSLDIKKEIGNIEGIAVSLSYIGEILLIQGNLTKALEYFERSLKMKQELGYKHGIAGSLSYIGIFYLKQSEFEKAFEFLENSLKIEEEIGNKQGIATSLGNIGAVYDAKGDSSKALKYFEKGLKLSEEIGNKQSIAGLLGNIGGIYQARGEYSKSLKYHEKSLSIKEEIGNMDGIAASMNNIGSVYNAQGNLIKGLYYGKKSLEIEEFMGNKQGISISLSNIGRNYHDQGELEIALHYYFKSLEIAEELGSRIGISASLNDIGTIYGDKRKMQYDLAIEYYLKSLAISNSIGANSHVKTTVNWILELRKFLRLEKFKLLIQKAFDNLDSEMQQHLSIEKLIMEPFQVNSKVGRNDPCPCGSLKKFKFCHGK